MTIFIRRTRVGLAAACLALTCAGSAFATVDAAQTWNEAIGRFLDTTGVETPPQAQARAYAMTHLAIEQAILGATDAAQPVGAPETLQQAAAICAAHEILTEVLPAGGPQFNALFTDQYRELNCEPTTKTRALTLGHRAAAQVLKKRETDRWNAQDPRQAAMAALGDHLASGRPSAREDAKSPWSAATPFVIKSVAQFSADQPQWLDLDGRPQPNAGLARARIFDHVDHSTASDTLAQFWSESPVVAWNRVAREIVRQSGLDLASRARVLAVASVAIADATIASLHWQSVMNRWTSYRNQVWMPTSDVATPGEMNVSIDGISSAVTLRPETRQVLVPPVRDYPSTAATVASAASSALSSAMGRKPGVFELAGPLPALAPRTYADLTAAARECAYASSLDGRHCREACVAGYRLGESIGNYVAKQAKALRK